MLNGVSLARFGAEIVFLKIGDLGGGKQLKRLTEEIKAKKSKIIASNIPNYCNAKLKIRKQKI